MLPARAFLSERKPTDPQLPDRDALVVAAHHRIVFLAAERLREPGHIAGRAVGPETRRGVRVGDQAHAHFLVGIATTPYRGPVDEKSAGPD